MHIGTFKFKTLALGMPAGGAGAGVLLRRFSDPSFFDPFSAFRTRGSRLFEAEPPRRTCQTGLLRPKWTPGRPGLLGHFLDLDSPAELLLEHGALLTFRVPAPPAAILGRTALLPADRLRENGHILMFNSAELAPLPLFLSFFFSFSLSSPFFALFFSPFLKMSFHRFDAVDAGAALDISGPGPGSGSVSGIGGSESGASELSS